jgi:hypothetical protein
MNGMTDQTVSSMIEPCISSASHTSPFRDTDGEEEDRHHDRDRERHANQ